ncbi:hypothetical protein NKDENANG_01197 [Candidatus Entotheonellaceae bacterium PAL068K]
MHLIGNDRDAVLDNGARVCRIKIGQRQVSELPGCAAVGEVTPGFKIVGVLVLPPVQLQQVERGNVHAP